MLYIVYHAHVDPLTLLSEVGDYADFSVRSAVAAYLARPGEAQNIETARQILIECLSRSTKKANAPGSNWPICFLNCRMFPSFAGQTPAGSAGPVVREASGPWGIAKNVASFDTVECLPTQNCQDAARASGKTGGPAVALLRDGLTIPPALKRGRQLIPPILVSIGTPAATNVVLDNLFERDTAFASN